PRRLVPCRDPTIRPRRAREQSPRLRELRLREDLGDVKHHGFGSWTPSAALTTELRIILKIGPDQGVPQPRIDRQGVGTAKPGGVSLRIHLRRGEPFSPA